jgi:hypothetical protein
VPNTHSCSLVRWTPPDARLHARSLEWFWRRAREREESLPLPATAVPNACAASTAEHVWLALRSRPPLQRSLPELS